MTVEEQHAAFPKLMGAPAYARPPAPVDPTERPFDPDLLPLESQQTDEDRAFVQRTLMAPVPATYGGPPGDRPLTGRAFTLRALTDRFRPRI